MMEQYAFTQVLSHATKTISLSFLLTLMGLGPVVSSSDISQLTVVKETVSTVLTLERSDAGRADQTTRVNTESLPAGVGENWQVKAQSHLAQREYHIKAGKQGLSAPNRQHGLRTYFSRDGIRMVDRTTQGSPELLSLRYLGLSRQGTHQLTHPAKPGELKHNAGRVELPQGQGVIEWYENASQGLEHGFLLTEQPEGEGELTLSLEVGSAKAKQQGEEVEFVTPTGRVLNYGKLLVKDAEGHAVPARLEVLSNSSLSIIVADKGFSYPLVIDPLFTATADWQIIFGQVGALFGYSVASAGDVNGDGYGDVIIGAGFYDNGETEEGAAFIYHGSATGLSSTEAVILESNQADALMGMSVASAGDVNGDGYGDVIVGVRGYSNGEAYEGAAFVYMGSATGLSSTAAVILESNQAYYTRMGDSVASAGDVNGDGYGDVIVGVPEYGDWQTEGVPVFVYLGAAAGLSSTPAITLYLSQFFPENGPSVASAGDVNGDGYGDVIVGFADYDISNGAAFVYHGQAEPDGDNDGLPDWYENLYDFLNPLDETDAVLDQDSDGLSSLEEYLAGTQPDNPDSDADGRIDGLDSEPLVPAPNLCGGDNVVLINDVYATGTIFDCRAQVSIRTDGTVTVESGAEALYMAPVLRLDTGFSVEAGGVFHAVSATTVAP